MITADNPHREHLPYASLVYWQALAVGGSIACGKNDKWTNVTLEGHGQWPRITFENTKDDLYRLDQILRLLERAFNAGRSDKAAELCKVLGVDFRGI